MNRSETNDVFIMYQDRESRTWWYVIADSVGVRLIPARRLRHTKGRLIFFEYKTSLYNGFKKVKAMRPKDRNCIVRFFCFIKSLVFRFFGAKVLYKFSTRFHPCIVSNLFAFERVDGFESVSEESSSYDLLKFVCSNSSFVTTKISY